MSYKFYFCLIFVLSIFSCQLNKQEAITIGESISIYSNILGEDREIYIYEPEGFWGMDEEMENLPVVYVLDGETQFLNTVSTIDYLSAAPNGSDFMPRSLIVGIPNTNRNRDLTPIKGMLGNDPTTLDLTGGGPKFLDFITTELMPYIDKHYKTCNYNRTIIGHSLGGLTTFDALLNKREYFNNYVAIDPGLGFANKLFFNSVLDTLRNSDLSEENLFFASANTRPSFLSLQDLQNDTSDVMELIDKPNTEFLNLKASEDWTINLLTQQYEDESHTTVPLRASYDAMKYFYNYYRFKEMDNYYHPGYSDRKDIVSSIKQHYKKISEKMGCEIIPMEGYINSFAFGISMFGRHDLAIDLFNYNIELYPENPTVFSHFAYYYIQVNNNKEAISQFDKSLKLSNNKDVSETRNRIYNEMKDQNKR